MSSLISMAVHDTEENGRSVMTQQTIECILSTVDLDKHRLIIINNNSCDETRHTLGYNESLYDVITLPANIGTAAAINLAWKQRKPGEHCIKIDNDVVIHCDNWVEQMEEAIKRDPMIGQVGLKRKDLWECPDNKIPDRRSSLHMLPHEPGESWIVVEKSKHIMGTCVMHSAALIDKIGYLYQPGLYGYDDVLMSWRSNLAGFYNCFLSHINIDHIDPGGTDYVKWKQDYAGRYGKQVSDIVDEYIAGKRPLYYE